MANIRRTAMGSALDIDRIRLANENTIAIGNTKTNARGDQLGPGGKVIKTRAQIQQEYYKLNTPTGDHNSLVPESSDEPLVPTSNLVTPFAEEAPVVESSSYVKPRGSFAEAVAGETEVKTELLDPLPLNGSNKSAGLKRI